ncbi:MAG: cysteine--tRNA ligase [Caldilinea sp. CFX5]|nr:cysteine--tRNA ligase [Caldilinea sp. CFX5]
MQLYNTRTRKVEPFRPTVQPITIYVCGITPYDTTHLGHAFTYVVNDTLIRYLEYLGYKVRYVQNVTDIDDDILRKADEVGENWRRLGNRWTIHFIEDLIALNVRPPDFFPRATDVIPQIIAGVEKLLDAGVAYVSGGNVYYAVAKWPDFGKLSGLPPAEQLPIANERGNRPDDPHKRNPLDFVLWQARTGGEPAWDSPWGAGRPGWHIECSSMATYFLGETIDLHSGGSDLLFPHHECEVAQAEPITGKRPFVRCWLHVAMVRHQGEKMSKSLGNLVMVRDLLQRFSPDSLRLYLAQHHYRTAWNFNEKRLQRAATLAEQLRAAAQVGGGQGQGLDVTSLYYEFNEALRNDLDTPTAIDLLITMAEYILAAAAAGWRVAEAQTTLVRLGQIFGLRLGQTTLEERVTAGWQQHLTRFT